MRSKNICYHCEKTWVDTTSIIVRRAAIENAIYNIDGITDVTNVLINGGTENITLQENVIPIKGRCHAVRNPGSNRKHR